MTGAEVDHDAEPFDSLGDPVGGLLAVGVTTDGRVRLKIVTTAGDVLVAMPVVEALAFAKAVITKAADAATRKAGDS